MKDLISRQAVLNLLHALPPEDATTKALLIQSVKQMDDAQPSGPDNLVKDSQGLVKDLVNDCISRKAAIDALDEIRHALWEIDIPSPTVPEYIEHHEQIQSVWKLLDKKQKELYILPSAQPEQQWVPCSERLPEEDTKVLISYCYKEGEGDTDHVNIDITSYGTTCFGGREIHTLKEWRQPFDYFHANYEVIAWMPLPEPYREDDDERPD